MLSTITLKFTETPDITITTKGITIFVGPNNSGKSLALKEVEQLFLVHPFPSGLKILKDYEVSWPDSPQLEAQLAAHQRFAQPGIPMGYVPLGRIQPNGGLETANISKDSLTRQVSERRDKHWYATQYLKWGVIRLDGRSRFNLTNDQPAGDILAPPINMLSHLFQDDAARAKVREIIKDAFNLNFVIDPTNLGQFRIRLSRSEPPTDEQSLNETARAFHRDAVHIKEASDGVQAFTGITTAVLSGEYHTLLIDEPEAFLHPPLARKLGKNLAAIASERGGTLMASTHSSDFLMGCVQGSPDVRVVRLEYSEGKSRGRMIDPTVLETFFRRPLMRSANVISGLFYDGVVVVESDNDRAFYGEIFHRLAAGKKDYPSILFINAQNKQTIREMIGPLRRFGVPAAAIADIDFVKDGGKNFTDWLTAAHVPGALHQGLGTERSAIDTCLKNTGRNMKTDGGVSLLRGGDKEAAEHFFEQLEAWGVFIVRGGELENWLPELNVTGKKTDWTVATLDRLGSDPSDAEYVKPTESDVWAFMERVVNWIKNASRKGMG